MSFDPAIGWRALPQLLDQSNEFGLDAPVREKYKCSLAELVSSWVSRLKPSQLNPQAISAGAREIAEGVGMLEAVPLLQRLLLCHVGLELHYRQMSGTVKPFGWHHSSVISRFAREFGNRTGHTNATTAGASSEASLRHSLGTKLDGLTALRQLSEPAALEVIRERVARIDAARVQLAPIDHSFETCADDLTPLPAETAVELAQHKLSEGQGAMSRAEKYRCTTDPTRFDAYLDERRGTVLLRERIPPAIPELDALIDTEAGAAIVGPTIDGTVPAFVQEASARILAGIVPTPALEFLAGAGVTHTLDRTPIEARARTPKFRRLFGDGITALENYNSRHSNAAGTFCRESRDTHTAVTNGYPPRAQITALVHETMHALDYVLGVSGQWLSDSDTWQELFEETRDGVTCGFPTDYARTDSKEFFAECATVFLTTHVRGSTDPFGVTTRSDLEHVNPKAYRLLRELFLNGIPELAASRQSDEATVRAFMEEWQKKPRSTYNNVAASERERAGWRRDNRLSGASGWAQVAHLSKAEPDRKRAMDMLEEILHLPDLEQNHEARARAILTDLEALS